MAPQHRRPTLADAIMDRLLYNVYRIELKGESMRTRKTTTKTERKEAIVNNE
ncbi:MAG: hypothetical protein HYX84_05735 [Chloroflexi bacterium]|nr:hypothetical protein [Chloroflexota bacterium]